MPAIRQGAEILFRPVFETDGKGKGTGEGERVFRLCTG